MAEPPSIESRAYLIKTENQIYVMKVMNRSQETRVHHLLALQDWCASFLTVIPPIMRTRSHELFARTSTIIAVVMPFSNGEECQQTDKEAWSLGKTVAKLHHVLAKYPDLKTLSQFLWRWPYRPTWCSTNAVYQLIHGDLTKGNIVFANHCVTAIFDFGQAHTGDPRDDLATVIHRTLRPSLQHVFLEAYGWTARECWSQHAQDLLLQKIVYLSTEHWGESWASDEVLKFRSLLERVQNEGL